MRRDPAAETAVVDIWMWNLDVDESELATCEALLADEELSRASRFVHARDRRRFIAGRGRLRSILAAHVGSDPRELSFTYNDYGKPRIGPHQRPPCHFNLSHSAGLATLAVCDACGLGVDIEEVKSFREDVAARFFSATECATLRSFPADRYLDGFYRCWTRKEAFVKAHGEGLSLALNSFDVTFDDDQEPRLERLDGDPKAPANWRILNLDTPADFRGAVAVLTMGRPVRLRYRDGVVSHKVAGARAP